MSQVAPFERSTLDLMMRLGGMCRIERITAVPCSTTSNNPNL